MALGKRWDVFISHASEDKRAVALPLADALRRAGLSVWLDVAELRLGDSLRGKISEGLSNSRFGVVVLSPDFFRKNWPQDELRALMAREEDGRKALLPVLHRMTRQQLLESAPLLGDHVIADYDAAPEQVVAAIVDAAEHTPASVGQTHCIVDFSHGQREWEFLASFFDDRDRFTPIEHGLQEQSELLAAASVLVLPPPFHCRLERAEIDRISRRVDDGMGLLLMGIYAERHHAMNVSELAWRFDLEFVDDIVLPPGTDLEKHGRDHVFSRDARLGVHAVVDPGSPHPLLEGLGQPVFLSAASIRQTTQTEPELVLHSQSDALRCRPLGRILPDGSRPNISTLHPEGAGATPLLVARRFGKGRVVIAGTWKLCTVDHPDNQRLIDNALSWLAARDCVG